MEPTYTTSKDFIPIKISRFQHCSSFIGTIVEYHRRSDAIAQITVNRGNIWSTSTIVFEPLIKWLHAHFLNPGLHQFANAIINHRRGNPRFQAKAVRQVSRHIVLTTGDMNIH